VSEGLLAVVRQGDLAEVDRLLDAGADPNNALHAAAEGGPLALVELLIRRGAIEWRPDPTGRTPLDAAIAGGAGDRAAIIELLDRPVIRDPSFRNAVSAVQAGDLAALERIVDDEPRLLHERIREPSCYRDAPREQYFLDPQLLWFVANNPILVDIMPANIVEVTCALLVRGADGRDVTLGLVMTSATAREQGHQIPLMETLLAAGAVATQESIDSALAHRELEAVRALDQPLTASTAAAFGRTDELAGLLTGATPAEAQMALTLAVVNNRVAAARVALDAGADVNAFSPVHGHSVVLHQATLHDDVGLLELLVARGARLDVRDALWHGTPHDWAMHEHKSNAARYLERIAR
jgi:peptide-methionine (S)-S-oxide reductase